MSTIKTAISLQKSLFEQVDALARELKVSRSRLLTLAIEEFLHRHENQQLLESINNAYEDEPDIDEQLHLRHMRNQQRKIVGGEW